MNWNEVIPNYELNYMIGNHPFIGSSEHSKDQKNDIKKVLVNLEGKNIKIIIVLIMCLVGIIRQLLIFKKPV